jgi:hypothetical protein
VVATSVITATKRRENVSVLKCMSGSKLAYRAAISAKAAIGAPQGAIYAQVIPGCA